MKYEVGLLLSILLSTGVSLIPFSAFSKPENAVSSVACLPKHETVIVNGDSMSPLFKNGQELKVDLNYYHCHLVAAGDVIVFEIPGRKNRLVKKVYAVPGDHFSYPNPHLEVNKKRLVNSTQQEFRISSPMLALFAQSYPIVPKDSFLVLGDNPSGSFDASKMGFIDRKQILGRVLP